MTRPLIGTDPDQVPRNAFLGELARMSFEELVLMVANTMTQKLSTTGLGAVNDLRNTIFEKGTPKDIFNTGMTTGLARAGADGLGISDFGNEEYGALIVNAQWTDSSIGPAYNRIYFRSGRMWFQAMSTASTWSPWIEVATGATAMGKSLLTATNMAGALAALGLVGLGNSADLRGNVYETGAPNTVSNKGLAMGLVRGGSDGLAIPALGSTANQYGTLVVFAGYNDLSGGPAYNRMFIRGGRMWIQPYKTSTSWGAWSEVATNLSVDNAPWITPTLLNGWTQYSSEFPLGYRKCAGHLQLKGIVQGGTIGQPIMALPAGYRPPQKTICTTVCGNTNGLVPNRLDIASDGTVYATGGSNQFFGLDNVWIPLA